jgi:phage terminase Nu1 subunit (DNA packaging protein)
MTGGAERVREMRMDTMMPDLGAETRKDLGLMTEEQIAAVAGVDTKTVKNWRTMRFGPPFTKMGKAVLYRRESVLRWLAENERETE